MSDYTRKPSGHDCPPLPEDPAPQPQPPGHDCEKLPTCDPPVLEPPKKCPDPDPHCKCPKPPGSNPNCLEDLIAKQTADILMAGNAEQLKKELTALLGSAKNAAGGYTRATYEELVSQWLKQDMAIAELIRKLVCAVPCWRCILDCYVCPLLNDLRDAEKWLYDDGKLYTEVHDLYDLQYWHTRDKAAKQRLFTRVEGILKAWLTEPAKKIGEVLNANQALIKSAGEVIGNEPGKAIYDVFFRLIPLHLAIAPPASGDTTTRIDARYTKFCPCDEGKPVDCCGLNVGEWSLRQRLIGPHPYLIDPNDYYTLICCLVEKRYLPAKDALSKADTELAGVTARIARYEKQLTDGLVPATFAAAAKAAIPGAIDCCDYEKDYDGDGPKSYRSR